MFWHSEICTLHPDQSQLTKLQQVCYMQMSFHFAQKHNLLKIQLMDPFYGKKF